LTLKEKIIVVDQACRTGRVTVFELSSTVSKAACLLATDGLTRANRLAKWYERHPRNCSATPEFHLDADELARVRREIAATFPE